MSKLNKPTQSYMDKIASDSVKDVYINSDNKVDISGKLKEKVLNCLKKDRDVTPPDTFSSFPYLRQDGVFTASIIDKRNLSNSDGIVLLVYCPQLIGEFRIGIFYNGFSYSYDDPLTIEQLVDLLQPGDEIVFRIGTNYRKTKFYVRYVQYKNYELGRKEE